MARRCLMPPHGHRGRYAYYGCRCAECREANRLYEKRWRQRRLVSEFVPAIGMQRRLQALVAYGYGMQAIADQLGVGRSRAFDMVRRSGPRGVLRRTADEVRDLFDRLTAQPAPSGRSATFARTVAAKYGWAPPLAWDDATIDNPDAQPWDGQPEDAAPVVDEVASRRALNGERIKLTRLEKHHAIHARGRMSLQQAADGLHLSYSRAKELAALPLPTAEECAA